MTSTATEVRPLPTLAPRGAEERMRVLYEVHAASLLRTLLGWTKGDRQAAEDLMQETMLRAWRHLGALHEDPRSVRPWLLTVARRLAIDALRARAARPPEVEDEPLARIPVVAQPMEQVLDRQVLRDAMASLTATHRTVVVEVYIRQQSVREVAERLGIPEGTVKSRSYNALRALRDALGHDPAFESRGPGRAVALRGGRAAGRALTAQRAA